MFPISIHVSHVAIIVKERRIHIYKDTAYIILAVQPLYLSI